MTEIDYLKCKLEDTEKAFDKLHKRYIELLKQQGNLEKENEQLRKQIQNYEQLISNSYVGEEVCSHLKKENKSLIENIFDIYEKVKWVSK